MRDARLPGSQRSSPVTQLIREAREEKGDLVGLLLDLAKAYGSIPTSW